VKVPVASGRTQPRAALAMLGLIAACGGSTDGQPGETTVPDSGAGYDAIFSPPSDATGTDAAGDTGPLDAPASADGDGSGPGDTAPSTDARPPLDGSPLADAAGPEADASSKDGESLTDATATESDASSTDGASLLDAAEAADSSPCPSNQLWCGGLCVPNDAVNCGTCGNDCSNLHTTSTPDCQDNQCAFPGLVCQSGWAHCTSQASAGCETDLSQATHCGSCTNACTAAPVCTGSASAFSCVKVVALGAGFYDTYAVMSDGTVYAWGDNSYDQLGNGDDSVSGSQVPLRVAGIANAVDVKGGYESACALLMDGTVSCWGTNVSGILGTDPNLTSASITPIPVAGLSGVTAISVGGESACAVKSDGSVACWGYNVDGEIGSSVSTSCDGSGDACTYTPTAVKGLAGKVTAISSGNDAGSGDTTCALLANGGVQCWGYNGEGELGDGNTALAAPYGTATPTTVSGLANVTALDVHDVGTCALISGGTVKCWGSNGAGQLGNGNTSPSPTPVSVKGLSDAIALSSGSWPVVVCAIRSSGAVVCWGNGENGQLGNGLSGVSSSTPVPVSGVTSATAAAGGAYHMCILLTSGDVVCSGFDGDGELANPAADPNKNPTPLPVVW
jgi:alpha-tubulin suppressor-like RCC1 family protein